MKAITALVFLAVIALTESALAAPQVVTLLAHNQRSSSGTRATLVWKDCSPSTNLAPCIASPTPQWNIDNNVVGSDATWTWDDETGVLTGTGLYWTTSYINSNPLGTPVISDRVVNLVIDTLAQTTTFDQYTCIEGTFLAGVNASGCRNIDLGFNSTLDSVAEWNVPTPIPANTPYCVTLEIFPDDFSLVEDDPNNTGTPNPRGGHAVPAGAMGPGCTETSGGFDLWTVIDSHAPGAPIPAGYTPDQILMVSNGVPVTSCTLPVDIDCQGANWMTFLLSHEIEPVPGAHADSATAYLSTPISINVLANDVGFNDPVTVTVLTAPVHGSAVVIGSPGAQEGIRILYTASGGYSGTDSLVYQVTDGVTTASATVAITVRDFKAVNDDFVVLRNYCCNHFYVATNDLGFTDPVTVSLTAQPNKNGYAYVSFSPGPKSQIYINYDPYPPANEPGNYTEVFSYRVSDGVHTDTATVSVQVVAFKAQDDSATTNVGDPITISVGANDLGFAYPATAGIFTSALHGDLLVNGSPGWPDSITITYRPNPGFEGTDTFQYAMDDGTHLGIATVTVDVLNDADQDGTDDAVDNCLDVANADQRDSNGDGYGNACDADLNDDGTVNFADLSIFRQRFATNDPDADLDGSGTVNFADLSKIPGAVWQGARSLGTTRTELTTK